MLTVVNARKSVKALTHDFGVIVPSSANGGYPYPEGDSSPFHVYAQSHDGTVGV
jgi:hypothetical protein